MNTLTRDDKIRMVKASLAHEDLLRFMRFCWTGGEEMKVGRHTREICARMDKAMADFDAGRSTYLVITVPFRHGKSEIISRKFPPFFLGHFPDAEVILATYEQSLSDAMSRSARALIRSDEYREVFHAEALELSRESASVSHWQLAGHEGKFQAVGIGGGSTGKGAHLLILDDYLKGRADAESQTIRNKQWEDFTGNLMSRLAPVHIVVILATPWHPDDIIGRIKNRLNTKHRDYTPGFPPFEFMRFPAKDEQTGAYLFPERFPEAWYVKMFETLGAYQAAALLQCDPKPRGGNMFRVEKIRVADTVPDDIRYFRFWDLASTEKERSKDDPDYTAGALVGVKMIAGEWHVFVKDLRFCQSEAPARNALIAKTAAEDGAGVRIGVESVAGYKDTYTTLRQIVKNRIIEKINANRDKVVRLSELEVPIEREHFFLARAWWNGAVLDELATFPCGAHDDKADAIAGAFEMAKKFARGIRMV